VSELKRGGLTLLAVLLVPVLAFAQPPAPIERVTFNEAITRAMERNPNSAIAAAGILRAQALLSQARSAALPQITGNVTSTTLNTGVEFEGTTVTPRSSVTGTLDLRLPLYAPAIWARRAEAQEATGVAALSAAETGRQTALATADAYLTILARRRVVETNVRARDAARAHFDLARQLEEAGSGSRLNRVRAQQELSVNEGLIETAQLALYRAQEALGVLLVADGPVDAAAEPAFDIAPALSRSDVDTLRGARTDLRLFAAEQTAADHVLEHARASYFPDVTGIFQPQTTYPSQFFTPQNTWRLLFQVNVPIFDSGARAADRTLRRSALDVSRATLQGAVNTATSEVRTGREAVASAERALVSLRAAAEQAADVVEIVNVSFRAGAATNIEVIDAERTARDADTAVVVGEDTLRRARFELLNAVGQFP
jgi:outer membrane protein TolC